MDIVERYVDFPSRSKTFSIRLEDVDSTYYEKRDIYDFDISSNYYEEGECTYDVVVASLNGQQNFVVIMIGEAEDGRYCHDWMFNDLDDALDKAQLEAGETR